MIKKWLSNFMVGRYGQDHLNTALYITSLIIWVIDLFVNSTFLSVLYFILIFLAIFRMFSRRLDKRRAENDRFLAVWWPLRTKIINFFNRLKQLKNYRFFKCPGCRNTLRVPRGKGKITITCPKCGERFQKKT